MAGEMKETCLLVDPEGRDLIAALIACVQEISPWIDREVARIIAERQKFCNALQMAAAADREYCDGIVQPIRSIKETSIARHHDLGTKICSGKTVR